MDIYLLKNDSKLGPYSEIQVHEMLDAGVTSSTDMAWREGLTEWIPLGLIVVGAGPTVLQNPSDLAVTGINRKGFRVMVGLSIVIFIAYMVACLWQANSSQAQTSDNNLSNAVAGFAFLMVAMIPSYVGMFLVKKWGRTLFVVVTVLILVVSLFGGPMMVSATANVLGSLSDMANGAVIAASFVTPVFNIPVKAQA